jgi:hypothetical protein
MITMDTPWDSLRGQHPARTHAKQPMEALGIAHVSRLPHCRHTRHRKSLLMQPANDQRVVGTTRTEHRCTVVVAHFRQLFRAARSVVTTPA